MDRYKQELKNNPNTTLEKPKPYYDWVYRPEMQFSLFDLQKTELRFTTYEENSQTVDLMQDNNEEVIMDLINLDLDYIDLLYDLTGSNLEPLTRFGGDRELVWAIGEETNLATITASGELRFENPDHLAMLNETDYLTIRLYQNNDSANVLWEYSFQVYHPMYADFNRNGQIEFIPQIEKEGNRLDATSPDKPYVFWINEDDDDPGSEVSGNDINGWNSFFSIYIPDHANSSIDGSRDLIDFFPVGINLYDFLQQNPDAENYTYTLKQADSAINIVYTEMDITNSDAYLKELDMANVAPIFGDWQMEDNTLLHVNVHKVTRDGIDLPAEFISLMKASETRGVLLAEANAETREPLELVVTDTEGKEVYMAQIHLRTVEVEDLYLQASLRDIQSDTNSSVWGDGVAADVSGVITQWNTDKTALELVASDLVDTSRHIIHVHGFANDIDAARAFQSETYKRLYHSGSNVLFTGVHWNGNEGFLDGGNNYWGNVENAFNTADDLAVLVNGIAGHKTILGHSLANVVVGSAIHDFNMEVDQYLMLNPATAIESYDAAQLEARNMRHTDWDEFYFGADYGPDATYTDAAGRRLWATEWYDLFPKFPDSPQSTEIRDYRNKLTWRNRFASIFEKTNVVQYYSDGEEVLKSATEGLPDNLDPVYGYLPFNDTPTGTNAWNIQEKVKGTSMLAATLAEYSSGGWGFRLNPLDPSCDNTVGCTTQILDRAAAEIIADDADELRINPFFKAFRYPEIVSPTAGSENARIFHPYVLGYEIPALSYAAGGASINKILTINKHNMNAINNGWPQERGGVTEKEWFHSDFKNVAYRYTYGLFDNMVARGAME